MLDNVSWPSVEFEVSWTPVEGKEFQRLVRYPTPFPSGDATNDLVSMEWYMPKMPRLQEGPLRRLLSFMSPAPPCQRGGRLPGGFSSAGCMRFCCICRTTENDAAARSGMPASSWSRCDKGSPMRAEPLMSWLRCRGLILRRSHCRGPAWADSWRLLPPPSIAACYHQSFIMLAGGDLYDMFMNGKQDTAKIRNQLAKAGYEGDKLKELLYLVEPTRIAHRLPKDGPGSMPRSKMMSCRFATPASWPK